MGDFLVWLSPRPVPPAVRRHWQWPGDARLGLRERGVEDVGVATGADCRLVCLGRGRGRRGRRRLVSARLRAEQLLEPMANGETAALDRYLGPVAGALVTDQGRRATIWRDRFGRHPLQIVRLETGMAVTSCPRAAARLSDQSVRWPSLGSFIRGTDSTTDADIFEDLFRIRPAELIRVREFRIRQRSRWWDPRPEPVDRPARRMRRLLRQLGSLYESRPHVLALSSGLDSSTLAAYLTRLNPDSRATTFTIGEDGADERDGAATTARHLGIRWNSFEIGDHWPLARPSDHATPLAWGPPAHPDGAWKMPFHRRLDRQGLQMPVVYGNGADEVLWVPPPIWFDDRWHHLDWRALAEAFGPVPLTSWLRPALRTGFRAVGSRPLRSVLPRGAASQPRWCRPDRWTPRAPAAEVVAPTLGPARRFYALRHRRIDTWGFEQTARSLAAERRTSGRPIWTPFLDAEFWELSLSLNPNDLVEGGRQKAVLRQCGADLLPEVCIRRPKTGGFDAVVERGLADRATRRVLGLSASSRLAQAWPGFDSAEFLAAWEAYRRTRPDHHRGCRGSWSIWKTLAAELWFRRLQSRRSAGRNESVTEVRS